MENNGLIVEEMKKRFQQICEYVTVHENLEEDENDMDMNADPNAGGGMPTDMGGDMGGNPNDGGMPPAPDGAMGADPNATQMPPSPDGGMGADPNGGGMPATPQGFDPQTQGGEMDMPQQDDMMNADPNAGSDMLPPEGDTGEEDADEIDITELTDSQKETEKEIDKMDNKFGKVMKMLGAFEELLRQNDKKIEALTDEFEKRNPTQIEKLSMRAANSYPFNVTPEQYWKEKESTSNYRVEDDDNGKEQGQYVITKDDVNGDVDWKSISDSLDDKDFIYNQTLKGAMGI